MFVNLLTLSHTLSVTHDLLTLLRVCLYEETLFLGSVLPSIARYSGRESWTYRTFVTLGGSISCSAGRGSGKRAKWSLTRSHAYTVAHGTAPTSNFILFVLYPLPFLYLYPGFTSMKRQGVLLLPLDGMLVHRRFTPISKSAGTHLYT